MSWSSTKHASLKQEVAKKKTYLKPNLKEYGSLAKFTRGSSTGIADKNHTNTLKP